LRLAGSKVRCFFYLLGSSSSFRFSPRCVSFSLPKAPCGFMTIFSSVRREANAGSQYIFFEILLHALLVFFSVFSPPLGRRPTFRHWYPNVLLFPLFFDTCPFFDLRGVFLVPYFSRFGGHLYCDFLGISLLRDGILGWHHG